METLSEDEEEECLGEVSEAVSIRANLFGCPSGSQGYSPAPGGPFSALTPSMWPQDLLASLAQVGARTGVAPLHTPWGVISQMGALKPFLVPEGLLGV